ncbi:MAG: hypothetical protein IJ815_03435 [Lachnospiraceae bacterium]|nr:hypothetical protein [Lachnospiraceae bacterium]
MDNKGFVVPEITEKKQAGDRARFTAYVQAMMKLERKAEMTKGGKKA